MGSAQVLKGEEDFILLHELADLLDRTGRTVAVVEREVDLAATDAPLLVEHLEIG